MQGYRTKTIQVKVDDETGTVTARFATLGVKDFDGDVIEKGAIGEQNVFLGAWNHSTQMLPAGKGATYETSKAALFKGSFFSTPSGRDHYTTIKESEDTLEWSFRFFVEDGGYEVRDGDEVFSIRKARVTHVAPVEAGAGIDTATVSIKHAAGNCADPAHQSLNDLATTIAAAMAKAMAPYLTPKNGETTKAEETAEEKSEELGLLIRDLRDTREISNEDLAQAAGISVATIGQILGGTLMPSVTIMASLAEALDVRLSRLVLASEAGDAPEDPVPEGKAADADDGAEDKGESPPEAPSSADGDESGEDDAAASSDNDGAGAEDDTGTSEGGSKEFTSEELERQVEAILTGYDVDADVDPGVAAWEEYEAVVGKE